MKKLLFLFIIGCYTLQGLAQDPQLFENTWYLHDLIIDGNSNPPPSNTEVPFVDLIFEENPTHNLTTTVCYIGTGEIIFDDPNSSFSIPGSLNITLISDCEDYDNFVYDTLYFDFFLNEISFPFIYEVSFSSGNFTLTITSESGDQAIYGDQILSGSSEELLDITFYPNPVDDILHILAPNNKVLSIEIYTIDGKRISIFERMGQDINEVSLANLNSGLYLLKIFFDGGQVTKKIIKK